MMEEKINSLNIHNGILAYSYRINGRYCFYSDKDLIERLAKQAGVKVTHTGDGSADEDRFKEVSYDRR